MMVGSRHRVRRAEIVDRGIEITPKTMLVVVLAWCALVLGAAGIAVSFYLRGY